MARATNARSSQYTSARKPFTANNLAGVDTLTLYIVYSYGWWPLFIYHKESSKWFENSDRYSVSTSKQRTQCHPGGEMILLSKEAMLELVRGGVDNHG